MNDRAICRHCDRNIYLSAATGRWVHGDMIRRCAQGTTEAEPFKATT